MTNGLDVSMMKPGGDEIERHAPTPEEGARLIRAFLQIEDEALRRAIIRFVEDLSAESGPIVRRSFLRLLDQPLRA